MNQFINQLMNHLFFLPCFTPYLTLNNRCRFGGEQLFQMLETHCSRCSRPCFHWWLRPAASAGRSPAHWRDASRCPSAAALQHNNTQWDTHRAAEASALSVHSNTFKHIHYLSSAGCDGSGDVHSALHVTLHAHHFILNQKNLFSVFVLSWDVPLLWSHIISTLHLQLFISPTHWFSISPLLTELRSIAKRQICKYQENNDK